MRRFNNKIASYNVLQHISKRTVTTSIPAASINYEFIDCGNFQRLENFNGIIVSRSCPTSFWTPKKNESVWNELSCLKYVGTSGSNGIWTDKHGNQIELNQENIDKNKNWSVNFGDLTFSLSLSSMGQVGVFPEQYQQWLWIQKTLNKRLKHNIVHRSSVDQDAGTSLEKDDVITSTQQNSQPLNVLNCFAYTGGSSMAALSVDNVQVTHLDASRTFVKTAMHNVSLSGLDNRPIRYIVDDCLSFVDKECKRGSERDKQTVEQTIEHFGSNSNNDSVSDPVSNSDPQRICSSSCGNNNNSFSVRNKHLTLDTPSDVCNAARNASETDQTATTCISSTIPTFTANNGKYDGLIFDPPAFGRGGKKNSKMWKISRDLPILFEKIPKLLSENPVFVLVTCHDNQFDGDKLAAMLSEAMKNVKVKGKVEKGEMVLCPPQGNCNSKKSGKELPLGCYARWFATY